MKKETVYEAFDYKKLRLSLISFQENNPKITIAGINVRDDFIENYSKTGLAPIEITDLFQKKIGIIVWSESKNLFLGPFILKPEGIEKQKNSIPDPKNESDCYSKDGCLVLDDYWLSDNNHTQKTEIQINFKGKNSHVINYCISNFDEDDIIFEEDGECAL